MKKKISCIMLIDDDQNDNYFHEREIKKIDPSIFILTMDSGKYALEYLNSLKKNKNIKPDLIFLDINLPGMNGWEFLDEYARLDKELQNEVAIIMLSSSYYSDDQARAMEWSFVYDYLIKPLTREKIEVIIKKYFL